MIHIGKKKIQEIEQKIKKEVPKYICKWCGQEKPVDRNFFKCSIDNGAYICISCIKDRYNSLCSQCEKALAILICCHYLDICFSIEVYNELKEYHGISDYVRLLNLKQHKSLENFENGLLKSNAVCIGAKPKNSCENKEKLNEIIADLQKVRNEL